MLGEVSGVRNIYIVTGYTDMRKSIDGLVAIIRDVSFIEANDEWDHEAIVEPVMWDAVQEKLKQKKEIESAVGHRGGQPHFLYGLIFCAECGASMTRRTLRGYDGANYKAWTCRERHKGRKGNGCTCRTIRETDLLASICVQMGWEQVSEERRGEIEMVMVSDDGVEIVRSTLSISA